MRYLKFILAIVLTLLLLVIARKMSSREPELIEVTDSQIKLSHTTVTEKVGPGEVRIEAKLTAPESLDKYILNLYYKIGKESAEYARTKMVLATGTLDRFSANLPSLPKGKRIYYYLSLTDSQGKTILTLPEKINLLNDPLLVKFKGKVAAPILAAHIWAMFGSIFFVFLVLFYSLQILKGKDSLRNLSISTMLVTILSFLGGVPLGILVTNQTFGEIWGGFPVFTDITDTKTSILIFYWVILLFLMKGSAFKKDKILNLLKDKTLAFFGILGFLLTLMIYLIPHSI
ncbi:MAG: hypothetical protein OEV55_02010 [candidate division Zixibacteria bacterium]|nr:hypothetical protein [candidate division Zixibacteria bacterium]